MCHWAAERERGISVTDAAETAAGGVMLGEGGKQLTARSLLSYVRSDGRISPSRRGAHAKE